MRLNAAVTFFFFFFFAFHFSGKKFVPPPPHFSAPSYATDCNVIYYLKSQLLFIFVWIDGCKDQEKS